MKSKAQAKFVVDQNKVRNMERTNDIAYSAVKARIRTVASEVTKAVTLALVDQGINITAIKVKIVEEQSPTIDEMKKEFTIDIMVEGEPYREGSTDELPG